MSDFTKEELQIIHLDMTIYAEKTKLLKESPSHKALRDKIESMIENYCEYENIQTVGTGQLLFHNKESVSAIVPKIEKQFDLCDSNDESMCFRIDWKIFYGKKFGQ